MAKKKCEINISFGDDLKDDFTIEVVGLPKKEVIPLAMDGIREALKKDKRVKDITTFN